MKYWRPSAVFLLSLVTIALRAPAQSNPRDSSWEAELIATAESFFSDSKYDSPRHYCDLAENYSRKKATEREWHMRWWSAPIS